MVVEFREARKIAVKFAGRLAGHRISYLFPTKLEALVVGVRGARSYEVGAGAGRQVQPWGRVIRVVRKKNFG